MCCAWMQKKEGESVYEYRAKRNGDSEVCDCDILADKTHALYMKVKEETKRWKKQQP